MTPEDSELGETTFLARRSTTAPDGTLVWKDDSLELQRPAPYAIAIPEMEAEFKAIKKKPVDSAIWEVDMNSSPAPVMPDDERPFFPEIILLGSKGQVGDPQLTSQGFWAGAVPEIFELITHSLAALPKKPRELRYMDLRLQVILEFIGSGTGIKIKFQEDLPTLEPAFLSLMDMMAADLPAELLESLEGLEGFEGFDDLEGFSDGKLH